jgi:signal transduction histidine kinase
LQPVIDKFYNSLRACKAFEEQQNLLDSLESRNQEISDYTHMISHDLKTPLRSIDALTAWFKEDYADQLHEDATHSFTLIRENVEKMDKLINSILQYSTISKNRESSYVVDLDLMLEEIVKTINWPAHIQFNVNSKLPLIIGDHYRLQQLFKHLIENAIKYNDKEKGLIAIDVEELGEFYKFSIKDNGKGIAKKYHSKIFNTFKKLDNNTDSLGIGLSVVKRIVKMYHGDLWVDSEVGKGTTFYFTLKK